MYIKYKLNYENQIKILVLIIRLKLFQKTHPNTPLQLHGQQKPSSDEVEIRSNNL
jgi:hypothetical protein